MSDITQNFEINSIDLGVTVDTNQLTFTPDGISLNFYTGGLVTANSLNANIANVHIYDGVNGYVLQTDGTGNLSWTAQTGNGGGNGTPGGANTQVQYNDSGSFGGNAGFTFNEITGNLNVPGNIIAGNLIGNLYSNVITSNLLILNADAIALGNNSSVNYGAQGVSIGFGAGAVNPGSDAVAIGDGAGGQNQGNSSTAVGPGAGRFAQGANSIAIGYRAGNSSQGANSIAIGDNAGYTSQGANSIAIGANAGINSQSNNSIILNATGANLDQITANSFTVKPVRLANTANVLFYNNSTGEISYNAFNNISNANFANYAGVVNSVAGANVSGAVSFATTANSVAGANVSGTVATATTATTAGTVVGTANLTSLSLSSSNIQLGANTMANSPGAIAIGSNANAGFSSPPSNTIAIGRLANSSTGVSAIAIGYQAFAGNIGISIGAGAGAGKTGNNAIAIGTDAGQGGNGLRTIAIGTGAANSNQGNNAIAIGTTAGDVTQGIGAIAIGGIAGETTQGGNSVALGYSAGRTNQGVNSVAIGTLAGVTNQPNNSIVISAIGTTFSGTQANSFFVKPIRNVTGNVDFTVTLKYNPTTGEIGYV